MLELILILQMHRWLYMDLTMACRCTAAKRPFMTIINHGADVNATNKNNVTALMIACYKGNIDAHKRTSECWS